MPVVKTSLDAYDSVDLAARQADVLRALRALGEATDQEIAGWLDWTINRVTPRRGELAAMGLVHRARRRIGPTGRYVSVWALVPKQMELFTEGKVPHRGEAHGS